MCLASLRMRRGPQTLSAVLVTGPGLGLERTTAVSTKDIYSRGESDSTRHSVVPDADAYGPLEGPDRNGHERGAVLLVPGVLRLCQTL
jgi:NAD(P)H-hydrate repair Nnr-like enzyme with NAD(P)H-hydrate dehydratase domain